MKINELYTFFTDTIFRRKDTEWRNPATRLLVRFYKLIYFMVRGLMSHGTLVRSAALTYYTVMSIVPVVAVIFAVVKGFGFSERLQTSLYELFPQQAEVLDYLFSFVDNALARTQGGLVATVALVMLFWSIIQVFSSIESAFNNIWEVKSTRSIARQWGDYLAVILIVPILWVVANSVGRHTKELLGENTWYFLMLSKFMSMIFIWIMFTFLYLIIPNAKVKLRSALTAGIAAGTIFLLFQWGYVYAQKAMTSYNAIYGSFAALPLFLIWIQISWEILLIGGELSFTYQNIARFGEEQEWRHISYDQRRQVMLATTLLIVRNFRDQGGAIPVDELREKLNLPTRVVNDVLFQLTCAGQLIEVHKSDDERETSYAPAYDITQMTVYGLLQAVEQHGDKRLEFTPSADIEHVEEVLNRLTGEALHSKENRRLIDLI